MLWIGARCINCWMADLIWLDLTCNLWRLKPALALVVVEVEYFVSLGPVGNLTSGLATHKCLSRWISRGHVDLLFAPSPQLLLSASICYTALFSVWDSEGSWWVPTQVPSSVFETASLPFQTSLILGAQQADADRVTWLFNGRLSDTETKWIPSDRVPFHLLRQHLITSVHICPHRLSKVKDYFGSMHMIMISLWAAVSGGNDPWIFQLERKRPTVCKGTPKPEEQGRLMLRISQTSAQPNTHN